MKVVGIRRGRSAYPSIPGSPLAQGTGVQYPSGQKSLSVANRHRQITVISLFVKSKLEDQL
jgi:hypothetical protein